MLAAVEILRRREGFAGYVHIKMLPGAERDQVIAATRLATRVAVNLEGPDDAVVRGLAREKGYSADLLPTLTLAGRLSRGARPQGLAGVPAPCRAAEVAVPSPGEGGREIRGGLGVGAAGAGCFLALRGGRVRAALPAEQLRLFPPGGHLTQGPWRTAVPPCAYR